MSPCSRENGCLGFPPRMVLLKRWLKYSPKRGKRKRSGLTYLGKNRMPQFLNCLMWPYYQPTYEAATVSCSAYYENISTLKIRTTQYLSSCLLLRVPTRHLMSPEHYIDDILLATIRRLSLRAPRVVELYGILTTIHRTDEEPIQVPVRKQAPTKVNYALVSLMTIANAR